MANSWSQKASHATESDLAECAGQSAPGHFERSIIVNERKNATLLDYRLETPLSCAIHVAMGEKLP